ncbi:unnamed protein product [Alopecurus aequalis]
MSMVGAGADSRALLALRSDAAVGQRRRQQWEVEFARYFTAPPRDPSTRPPPGVRYVFRAKHPHPGAWLPAAAPGSLCVSRPNHASGAPVLTVSIADVVFEEHFLSILNFSWPQVACMTECPVRGSRVVFVSFWDKSKQIQKFALRFPLISDAESFLNCVKECLGDTMDIIPSGSDYVCEDSSASEYVASNELQHSSEEPASDHRTEVPALCYHEEPDQPAFEHLLATDIDNSNSGFPPSFTDQLTNLSTENEIALVDLHHEGYHEEPYQHDDASSFEEPASDHRTEAPALCYHKEPDQPAIEPLLATNTDSIISGFPPSFTEMLINLSSENETVAEDPHPLSGTDHPEEVYTQDTSHDVSPSITVGSNESTAGKQIDTTSKSTDDIMARIKTYLADESFHDMLFKLGRVIDELGMDLSQ